MSGSQSLGTGVRKRAVWAGWGHAVPAVSSGFSLLAGGVGLVAEA